MKEVEGGTWGRGRRERWCLVVVVRRRRRAGGRRGTYVLQKQTEEKQWNKK